VRTDSIGLRVVYTFALPIVLLTVWWFASASSTSTFFPPLSSILAAFPEVWFQGRFFSDILPSLGRLLLGYGIGVIVAILLGVAIGSWQWLRRFLDPVLEFLRAVPPPVLVPVFMLFFRPSQELQVFIIAFGCVWPVLLNTIEGVRSVDEVQRDTASCYRFSPWRRFFQVTIPASSPQIFAGARQSLSIAIILMVISELFVSTNGLGYVVVQFQRTFQLVNMWTGIILLGIIGVLLSLAFRFIESRSLAWYTGLRRSERGE
jgi:ABC-type nitrate/sulfonate/bicarbonate transport system permease component